MTDTVRALTAGELIKLHSDQQYTKIKALFVPQPTVFQALLNGTPSSNEAVTTLTFDTVTVGNYTKLLYGMTLYIYSVLGAYVGMVRVRSATSTVITIGRCSDIAWVDNMILVAVEDFGFWAKLPYLGEILSDDYGTNVLMDDDVDYVDQNTNMQPVPIMGPDMAVPLTSGSVLLDGSNSYTLDGSTISTYAWSVVTSGSTVFTSGSISPTFTFASAGLYRVSLSLTSSAGKTTTGYRTLYVYNESDLKDQLVMNSMEGHVSDGGWSAKVKLWDGADLSVVKDRAKVFLIAQDYYGGSASSIGQVAGQEHVLMVGWIDGDSIDYDREVSTVDFDIQGAQFWINKITTPSTSLATISYESGDVESDFDEWLFFAALTIDKAIHHFFYWRSTVMQIMDVYPSNNTITLGGITAGIGSVWEQLNATVQSRMLMKMAVDRYSRLFLYNDPQLLPVASRSSIITVQSLTGDDFGNQVDIKRVVTTPVGMVEVSALMGTNTDTIAMSRAPGALVYKRYGENKTYDRCVVNSQTEANILSGMLLAKENNEYPEISVELSENNRMLDIAPAMYATMSVSGSQNARGISFTDKKVLVKDLDYKINPEKGFLSVEAVFEGETSGNPGVTVILPQEPILNSPTPLELPILDIPLMPNLALPLETPLYIPRIPQIPTSGSPISGSANCPNNADANGGFNLWFSGTYTSGNQEATLGFFWFPCKLRSSGHTYKSSYALTGLFQKYDSASNTYLPTTDDSWYTLYALNSSGSRIATAVHDAVPSSGSSGVHTRTGYFNLASDLEITELELVISLDAAFRPDTVTWANVSNVDFAPTLTWGYTGNGIWISCNGAGAQNPDTAHRMTYAIDISGSGQNYDNQYFNINYKANKGLVWVSGTHDPPATNAQQVYWYSTGGGYYAYRDGSTYGADGIENPDNDVVPRFTLYGMYIGNWNTPGATRLMSDRRNHATFVPYWHDVNFKFGWSDGSIFRITREVELWTEDIYKFYDLNLDIVITNTPTYKMTIDSLYMFNICPIYDWSSIQV